MEVYLTEEEQIERIKAWIKNYGATVVLSVVLAMGISFGWRYWQQRQVNIRARASMEYEQMMNAVANNDDQTAKLSAQHIIEDYSTTPYAQSAGLLLARQDVENGKYPAALTHLQWVMDHSHSSAIKQIAKNRAAKVLLGEGKLQEALQMLQGANDPAFAPVTDIILGDIYVAMKNSVEAQKAYSKAIALLPTENPNQALTQMKLNDLAEPTKPTT